MFIDFLRRHVKRFLEWLDRFELRPPRAKARRWYHIEFNLPAPIVGVVSAILLYLILLWDVPFNVAQFLGMALFVLILMDLFIIYVVREHRDLCQSGDAMALLAVIFFASILWIKGISLFDENYFWLSPYCTPIGIAPLLAALLLSPRLAMVVATMVAILLGMMNNFSLPLTLVGGVGGVVIVVAGSASRSIRQVARAGVLSGVVQMLFVIFLALTFQWDQEATWITMSSAIVSGLLSAFFSLGALPFLESFFSQTSNLRLLELADVNHPLLRKLSMVAPGTYHHSQLVASLSEDAANAIGANGLLARTGAYYHDIGKMVKAEYFIENQGTLGNPHDQVSPSLSRLVITSHVKEGLALAKTHKLDKKVKEFIPQHHGTSQIEYFYQKAIKLEEKEEDSEKEEVNVETYRYPGPKPQSKETGIVMLADSVEAASRTLEDPTHQRYKDLVYKIINKKLFDGQLEETPLTFRDLHQIAKKFTATLTSLHHNRIPYPESESSAKTEAGTQLTPPK